MFDIKYLSIFLSIHILALQSWAGLDSQRESSYQKIFNRYSKSSPKKAEPPTAEEKPKNVSESSFSRLTEATKLSGDSIVSEKLFFAFAQRNDRENKDAFNSNSFYLNRKDLFERGIDMGESEVLSHRIYNKRNFGPGSYIIVRSSAFSNKQDSFESSTYNFEREQRVDGITYTVFGEVSHTSLEDVYTEQRVSLLNTFDFDPCLVELGVTNIVNKALSSKTTQQQLDLAGQCVIGENIDGKIFASIVLTDRNGTLYKKIDLQGELTLKVAEALYLRFTSVNNGDEFSLSEYKPNFESEELENKLFFDSETNFFRELKDSKGRFNAITLEHKTDETKVCITTKSATLGRFKNKETALPAFLLQYSHSCDENRKEEDEDSFEPPPIDDNERTQRRLNAIEKGSETHLSFGNTYEVFGNQAQVFSFGKVNVDNFSLKERQALIYRVNDNSREYNIYELNHETATINSRGQSSRRKFKFIYTKEESFVVAEQLILIPMNNLKTQLRFQDPFISEERRKQLLRDGISEGQIQSALARKGVKKQLGLCFRIDCYELGLGVTFSNKGGVFVTARGKTIADFFGHEVEAQVITGLPLNSQGVNRSFDRFKFDDRSPFIELSLSSKRCDKTKEFCSEFRARKEGSIKKAQFVMEYQF